MHPSSRFTLGIALFAAVSQFAAAGGVQHNVAGQSPVNFRALQATANTARQGAQSSELYANPYRAYPASCLNAPLALGLYANDPAAAQTTILLRGDPLSADTNEVNYTETDTVTVFRVPCVNNESAVLVEIDRPSTASQTYYPVFPGIYIGSSQYVPRAASDPNTFYSAVYAFDPVTDSTVVSFENVFGVTPVNYNQALSVYIVNLLSGSNADTVQFNIPAYNPALYASTSQPMPLSGYQSGNFYDTAHGGEGIQVEVGDSSSSTSQRVITIAWYTFDESGVPYWLYGSASFDTGSTSVQVPLYYGTNGGFAGNFGNATFNAWGTITLNFPNCNTMQFSYTSDATIPQPTPIGSGSRTWTRLTQLNGLTCQ